MFRKTKIKQIISLIFLDSSNKFIVKSLDVSRNYVIKIRCKINELNLSKKDLENKKKNELYKLFFSTKFKRKLSLIPLNYNYVHDELKKVGVTLKLLWEEYISNCKQNGTKYYYSTFINNYGNYTSSKKYTSHINHKCGEDTEVDWSSPTMSFIDAHSRNKIIAYLFVVNLLYSQKTFVEATTPTDQDAWMNCNVDMFNRFDDVRLRIICGNCKTAVISHLRYAEIEHNQVYITFGEYYGVIIKVTHVRKPKVKEQAFNSVLSALKISKIYSKDILEVGCEKL